MWCCSYHDADIFTLLKWTCLYFITRMYETQPYNGTILQVVHHWLMCVGGGWQKSTQQITAPLLPICA
jgi:hypothetical protein